MFFFLLTPKEFIGFLDDKKMRFSGSRNIGMRGAKTVIISTSDIWNEGMIGIYKSTLDFLMKNKILIKKQVIQFKNVHSVFF